MLPGHMAILVRCCTLSFSGRDTPFSGIQHCFTCKTTLRTETLYLALRVGALSMPGKENDGNARLIWKEADQVKIEIEPLIHIINKST